MDRGKILVLDDDPVVALGCKRTLGAEGFNISTMDSGKGALEMLGKEHFDLLISDIRLPDMNGMSVLKEARTTHPDVDVVMITGYPTLTDAKESIRLGAVEYIEKPFTPDFLIKVVRKLFEKKSWAIRQEFIGEFRDCIEPLREGGVLNYEDGVWAKPTQNGHWEVGCDVRYCMLVGDLVYVEFTKGLETVKKGEPFARILTSAGKISELHMPMDAEIRRVNAKVNDVVVALSAKHLYDGWLLRLAKVIPLNRE